METPYVKNPKYVSVRGSICSVESCDAPIAERLEKEENKGSSNILFDILFMAFYEKVGIIVKSVRMCEVAIWTASKPYHVSLGDE
jgi:hypothetical protein